MDELDLIRKALGEPAADPAARERVRARLDHAIRQERGGGRRGRSFAAVAAVAAFLALALIATFASPFGKPSVAAAELRRLGTIASASAAQEIGEGMYLLRRSEELSPEMRSDLATGVSFTVLSRLEVQTWIAGDGSGFQLVRVISSEFAEPEDREAWEAAGRPRVPQAGEVRSDRYPADQTPWFDLSALPTDPEQLSDALRSIPRPPGDDQVFLLIGEMLAQGNASPSLRSSLFEVAAELEGVDLAGEVADPTGRRGIGLQIDGTESRTRLVFDPETADLVAIELYPLEADGSAGPVSSWVVSYPATVVDSAPV